VSLKGRTIGEVFSLGLFQDDWNESQRKVLDVLAAELPYYLPQKFNVEEGSPRSILEDDYFRLIYILSEIINIFKELKERPRIIDDLVRSLDSASRLLIRGGMPKKEIETLRRRYVRVGRKLENIKKQRLKDVVDPWLTNPDGALVYELTTTLKEAFEGLSQKKAIEVSASLMVEFGQEQRRRVRQAKVKVSKRDPLHERLERRLTRFKRKFGTPETIYSNAVKKNR